MAIKCERMVDAAASDRTCDKPATVKRKFKSPDYPAGNGAVSVYYFCSTACAEEERVGLWGIGCDPVGELESISRKTT